MLDGAACHPAAADYYHYYYHYRYRYRYHYRYFFSLEVSLLF